MTYSLGENLRRCRSIKNITQKELSVLAGVSVSAISKIELDKNIPALSTLLKIVAAIDMPLDCLLSIDERNRKILTAYIYHCHIKKILALDTNRNLSNILKQTFD